MRNFLFQIKINYTRIIFRNIRFLLFSIAMPSGFYLLFTQVMTKGMSSAILTTWNTDYLISMVVYSTLISSIFTVSNTLLDDHEHHFDLFVALSPISKLQYYSSMIVVFLSLTMVSTLVLEIIANFGNHVAIDFSTLIFLLIFIPILSLPLFLIGIMLSLIGSGNVINLISNLIVFPMAILSGLWWPLTMMPTWMQKIGKILPTYHIAECLKIFIHKQNFNGLNFGILLLWLIILLGSLKILTIYREKSEA